MKSQSLGNELGWWSSSMYLELTAHTNQFEPDKTAAYLRIREYEKYYYFKRSKRRKLTVVDHLCTVMDLLLHHCYSEIESYTTAVRWTLFLQENRNPHVFFFFFLSSFTKSTAKKKKKKSSHPGLQVVLINSSVDVWEIALWFYHILAHLPLCVCGVTFAVWKRQYPESTSMSSQHIQLDVINSSSFI